MAKKEGGTAKSARTRAAILAAAVQRFGHSGFRATSVAEICRDAGVSGSLAYAYFDNKEDLFVAAVNYDVAQVIEEGMGPVASEAPGRWQQKAFARLLDSLEKHALCRRILAGQEPQATASLLDIRAVGELRDGLAEVFNESQRGGFVRPDIDTKATARANVHLWIVMLMAAQQFGSDKVIGEIDQIISLMDDAMLTDAGLELRATWGAS